MTENIKDKVVVITGASSGLGAETARHLVNAGAKVALGARRKDRLDTLVAEAGPDNATAFQVDVTDRQQLHNAGLMPMAPLKLNRWQEWDACIDVNLKGVLYGLGVVLPIMEAQKSGHNIFISSVAGHVVNPIGAVYCATKTGIRVIAEALRQEVKEWGGRTTILSPGAVDTELPQSVKAEGISQMIADFYAKGSIPADSFARAALFAMRQPDEVDINEILFRPTSQVM